MKNSHSDIGALDSVDPNWKIGIIHSSFYKEDVMVMVESAKGFLIGRGVSSENIQVLEVAGSFEIPLIGSALAEKGEVDALMGFGIVIQGETQHAQEIITEASRGMMDVQTRYRIPFAFEVLHVDSLEDARVRVSDKGKEAAVAVLSSLLQLETINT